MRKSAVVFSTEIWSAKELKIQKVAVVREGVCPEDPHGVDPTVALLPGDLRKLVARGLEVSVEQSAGALLGISDDDYRAAGARIEPNQQIFGNKDLVVKIKGPPDWAISQMAPGTNLFCMAHLPMYPSRREGLEASKINVVAMEEVCDPTFSMSQIEYRSRHFAQSVFHSVLSAIPRIERHVSVVGYSAALDGVIRYLALHELASLTVRPMGTTAAIHPFKGENPLVIIDSSLSQPPRDLPKSAQVLDLAQFNPGPIFPAIAELLPRGQVPGIGKRRIESLHETGMAGARYGVELMNSRMSHMRGTLPEILVLGYGNVAMGAVDYCVRKGLAVTIMNRFHTSNRSFAFKLKSAELVINGALTPPDRAGIDFVLTKEHVSHHMQRGAVLIDLIGGSPSDRSPVEVVETCTFLGAPRFTVAGVHVASVFAWPNFYRPLETCRRYSSQIASVIVEPGGLADGVDGASAGIRRARVLGPYSPLVPQEVRTGPV